MKTENEALYEIEKNRLEDNERRRNIRQKAEKDFYGRVKSKRDNLSEEQKEDTLLRFNRECVICGAKEGLHIHHKDKNPQNNSPENLVVLCGVCHKKAHMKVR